jgi:hypothetical protein
VAVPRGATSDVATAHTYGQVSGVDAPGARQLVNVGCWLQEACAQPHPRTLPIAESHYSLHPACTVGGGLGLLAFTRHLWTSVCVRPPRVASRDQNHACCWVHSALPQRLRAAPAHVLPGVFEVRQSHDQRRQAAPFACQGTRCVISQTGPFVMSALWLEMPATTHCFQTLRVGTGNRSILSRCCGASTGWIAYNCS